MTAEKYASLAPNPIAVELGLDDPNGPTAVLAQLIEALGTSGSRDETNVLYMYLLDAWEKVFDNELEQSVLEEHMRWFFGKNVRCIFVLLLILKVNPFALGLPSVHPRQDRDCHYQTGVW